MNNKSLLKWQLDAGIDEAVDDSPVNYFALLKQVVGVQNSEVGVKAAEIIELKPQSQSQKSEAPLHYSPSMAGAVARTIADKCKTLQELEEAVRIFDGCSIKKTATKTVFADGNPQSKIMIIGDAPNAEEDVKGLPFCGDNGQLLDKMFAAIGLNRESIYISNMVFWRPAGNRQPTPEEIAICLPFVEKNIALVAPKILVLLGGVATRGLLQKEQTISKLRGKFYEYNNDYLTSPLATLISYHPSELIKQPLNKKQAWQDLLMIKSQL